MSAVTGFHSSTSVASYMPMSVAEQQQGNADTTTPAESTIPHYRCWSVETTYKKIQGMTLLRHLRIIKLAKDILCPQCLKSAKGRQVALMKQFLDSGDLADEYHYENFHPLTDEQITHLIRTDIEQLYQWMPTFVHHQWSLFTLADLLRIDFTKLRQIPHEQIKLRVGYIFNFLECTAVKKLLLDLKGDNLTVLFPFLEREHLQILTPEQIDTIDFEKIAKNIRQLGLKLSADQSNFALVSTRFRMSLHTVAALRL